MMLRGRTMTVTYSLSIFFFKHDFFATQEGEMSGAFRGPFRVPLIPIRKLYITHLMSSSSHMKAR